VHLHLFQDSFDLSYKEAAGKRNLEIAKRNHIWTKGRLS